MNTDDSDSKKYKQQIEDLQKDMQSLLKQPLIDETNHVDAETLLSKIKSLLPFYKVSQKPEIKQAISTLEQKANTLKQRLDIFQTQSKDNETKEILNVITALDKLQIELLKLSKQHHAIKKPAEQLNDALNKMRVSNQGEPSFDVFLTLSILQTLGENKPKFSLSKQQKLADLGIKCLNAIKSLLNKMPKIKIERTRFFSEQKNLYKKIDETIEQFNGDREPPAEAKRQGPK